MFSGYERWSFNRKRAMAANLAMTVRLCKNKVAAGSEKTRETLETWMSNAATFEGLVNGDTSLGASEKGVILADLRRATS
jgi:hypothetical protein